MLTYQISKAVTEHKKLVETSGRLQRMVPDKDAFVDNLFKARQAAHEVNTTQIDTNNFYLFVWNGQVDCMLSSERLKFQRQLCNNAQGKLEESRQFAEVCLTARRTVGYKCKAP